MSEKFWVYVNEPNNKALVHQASCSHCNNGQGRQTEKSEYNGEWLGPFSITEAQRRAWRSGKTKRRWCGFCARNLGIRTELDVH